MHVGALILVSDYYIGVLGLADYKKFVPRNRQYDGFMDEISKRKDLKKTESFIEIISQSGDVSGSPFAHWRWKNECLPKLIIWPQDSQQISEILRIANKHHIPITPRGAGSCYFGSSVPTYGGIILNLKKLDGINLYKEEKVVEVEGGVVFKSLIDFLEKQSLELPCMPSSALTSTVGGWLGVGGDVGIGTFQNGSLSDNIRGVEFIDAKGAIHSVKDKDKISDLIGSCGIFSIITKIRLKVVEKEEKIPLYFGFNDLNYFLDIISGLMNKKDIFYVKFSDKRFAYRLGVDHSCRYYLFIVLSGEKGAISGEKESIIDELRQKDGKYLGDGTSMDLWKDIFLSEMKIKNDVPILMMQSLNTDISNLRDIIEEFESLASSRKLNHCYYGIVNRDGSIRLALFTPTDSKHMVHFLSSKGVLHRIVKKAYQNNLGKIYSHGMVNSIYLNEFEHEKLKKLRLRKQEQDPNMILNPLKLVANFTSYRRINTIFELNLFWRKIAVKFGRAKRILSLNGRSEVE